MRILIACDSFKDCLPATDVCAAIASGITSVRSDVALDRIPLADGGEGSVDALLERCAGTWVPLEVMGPLPHLCVDAGYATFEHPPRAVVEMASASGLEWLRPDQRDPMRTTTYGTGQLIRHALAQGRPVAVAVGGSATVDGGVGAAMALGWRFLDRNGKPVPFGAAGLDRIDRIIPPPSDPHPEVTVLADVNHLLCGPEGAARVFGPQKGLRAEDIDEVDRGLAQLAECFERDLGRRVADLPGSGAAGGLAAGLAATLGARIESGGAWFRNAVGLEAALAGADWIITGEGRFDATSLRGKVVSGVIESARKAGVRVAVIAGDIALPEAAWKEAGVTAVHSLTTTERTAEQAIGQARELLAAAGSDFATRWVSA